MENNNNWGDPREKRGWDIVKNINACLSMNNKDKEADSLYTRKQLAEYFGLGTARPSNLHSAILSCAVKMAVTFPDFHFVPFLELWGLENLRTEDSESKVTEDGKRFPSLAEKLTKAYTYSILFHPDEHIDAESEGLFMTTIARKGYTIGTRGDNFYPLTPAIATNMFKNGTQGHMMTLVSFVTPSGEEYVAEVHTITTYTKLRYADIPGKMFNLLLRKSEKGNWRVEAAMLSTENISDVFATGVGYIEHIDLAHHHIHIFDNESRHMVAHFSYNDIPIGTYVEIVPIVPKNSNFKEAIILRRLPEGEGKEAFGYRDAIVTFTNEEQGYCAWELLPDAAGNVNPIVETGAKITQEPATKGYINKTLCDKLSRELPAKDTKLRIITFLKRGKDGKKRPYVVDYIQQ